METPYRDKDWLESEYTGKGKYASEIAREVGCSPSTISKWLKRYKIPTHPGWRLLRLDQDWLRKRYIDEKANTYQLAHEMGCSVHAIRNALERYGIPMRSKGEAIHLARGKHVPLSPRLLDILEGELLGDGCISSHTPQSAFYQHSSRFRSYLLWLRAKLQALELNGGKIHRRAYGLSQSGSPIIDWHWSSWHYEELLSLRSKWYPKGRKAIPNNLVLNDKKLLHWYLGDGSLSLSNGSSGKPSIYLAAQGFTAEGRAFLTDQLNKLGFKANAQKSGKIYISTMSTPDFLDYIGPCPIECYAYKWHYAAGGMNG